MEEIDLKDCWECSGWGIFVDKDGYPIWSKKLKRCKKTKWVSCEYNDCNVGVYTIKQWENHDRITK